MIEPRIIQALQHDDPTIRKKAIAALGKSNTSEALSILAKVYKHDSDPEVRELARKAGVYLKKQLNDTDHRPASKPARPADPDALSSEAMIAAAHANKEAEALAQQQKAVEAERKAHPLFTKVMEADLEKLRLSPLQERKVAVALDRAMNYSMTNEGELAREELRKAYELNPALRIDPYANSLTLQIVGGKDENEALETLLNESPLSNQKKGHKKQASGHLFGVLQMIAGVIMIAGFFMPWIDFNPNNVENTRTSMRYSGIEIFGNKEGSALIFTTFTPENLILLDQGAVPDLIFSRDPQSYSPALLAIGGSITLFAGLMGALGGTRRGYGLQAIFSAIIGSSGLIWLATSRNKLISSFEQAPDLLFIPEAVLETGFYVGIAGVVLTLVAGLIILLRRS